MESYTNSAQLKIDEDSWVIQIKEFLDVLQEEEEEEKEFSVSVFNVPKELLADKPEACIPQMVSIGPYHHRRSELHDMERHKLATACRFQKRMNGIPKFQLVVVDEFKKYDWEIRSCYRKFIEYKEETLAWIMALDAVFLLDCLQFYVRHADQSCHGDVKRLERVLDSTGTSAAHNSIFRDLVMLENQLRLYLMKKLLELPLGSKDKAEERLFCLLSLGIQEFSPFSFKLSENSILRVYTKDGTCWRCCTSVLTLFPATKFQFDLGKKKMLIIQKTCQALLQFQLREKTIPLIQRTGQSLHEPSV